MKKQKPNSNNSLNSRLDNLTHPKTFFVVYKGIKFKSRLEKNFYVYANETLGYDFKYEELKTVLSPSEKLECFVYAPIQRSKFLDKRTNLQPITAIKAITYSPDFHKIWKTKSGENVMVIVETKGRLTESYNIKKKLFISLINKKYGTKVIFFEPHNLEQFKQMFNILETI